MENGIIIPKHMPNYDNAPIGPLISRGAVSSIYLGQIQVNHPQPIPKKKIPMHKR